jgi:hypothetical protein
MRIVLGKITYIVHKDGRLVEKEPPFHDPVTVESPFTVSGTVVDGRDAVIGIAVNKLTGEVFQGDPHLQLHAASWQFKFDRLTNGNYALFFVGTKDQVRQEVFVGIGLTNLVNKMRGLLTVITPTPGSHVSCSFDAKGTVVNTASDVRGEINGQRQSATPDPDTGDWVLSFTNVTPSGLAPLAIRGDYQMIGFSVYVDPCPPTPSDVERPR